MLELLKMFSSDMLFTLIVPGIFVGIALLLAGKFLPDVFVQYKLPATLAGLALCIFFVFQSGRYNEYSKWKLEDAKQQVEIALLRAKSAEVNVEVVTKYVDKIKYVEKIKEVPVNVYVDKEADLRCVINPNTSDNIRMLINSSLEGKLPDGPIRVDVSTESTSTVTGKTISSK